MKHETESNQPQLYDPKYGARYITTKATLPSELNPGLDPLSSSPITLLYRHLACKVLMGTENVTTSKRSRSSLTLLARAWRVDGTSDLRLR